jgi:hypothetical protein
LVEEIVTFDWPEFPGVKLTAVAAAENVPTGCVMVMAIESFMLSVPLVP